MRDLDGVRSDNTSGYPGVSWYRASRAWCAMITATGRLRRLSGQRVRPGTRVYLGTFPTADLAFLVRFVALNDSLPAALSAARGETPEIRFFRRGERVA